jgi:inosine-uridine nucleoside N-ribohydrolase
MIPMPSIVRHGIPSLTTQNLAPLNAAQSSQYSTTKTNIPGEQSRTLLVDTDVGFDDILAISSLVRTKSAHVPFVSTVGGIQSCPIHAASLIQSILPWATVVPGRAQAETIPTPDWMMQTRRQLDRMRMELHSVDDLFQKQRDDHDFTTATSQKLADCLSQYPDRSVDILCLGPLTNVASWIEGDEETFHLLDSKLRQLWVMGGNLPSTETSISPEFNFAQDPSAAKTVLDSSSLQDRLYIVPAQTCEMNCDASSTVSKRWKKLVELATSQENNNNGILSKLFHINSSFHSLKYDALCAFSYARPDEVCIRKIHVDIDVKSGLLIPPSDDQESTAGINFVVDIALEGENGFLAWLQESIQNER